MKNLLVMVPTALALFVGSLMGLLWWQERLDHAGTRGIPVLEWIFHDPDYVPPPAPEPERVDVFRNGAGKDSVVGAEDAPLPDGVGGGTGDGADHAGGPGQEGGADHAAGAGDPHHGPSGAGGDHATEAGFRSSLFEYDVPEAEARLLDQLIRSNTRDRTRIRRAQQERERRIVALKRLRADLQRRIASLDVVRLELDRRWAEIDERIRRYRANVRIVPLGDDLETLKLRASRVAAFEPAQGAEYATLEWNSGSPERRKGLLNLLDQMPEEAANALLAAMDDGLALEIVQARIDQFAVQYSKPLPVPGASAPSFPEDPGTAPRPGGR